MNKHILKITIKGTDAVLETLKNKRLNTANILSSAVRASGLQVERQAKINCPVKTGNLRRSILSKDERNGNIFLARVGPDYNTAKYAIYVETGHAQEPGRYVPALGKRLVAAWVEGKWYMAKTAIQMRKKVVDNLKMAFRKALITK